MFQKVERHKMYNIIAIDRFHNISCTYDKMAWEGWNPYEPV